MSILLALALAQAVQPEDTPIDHPPTDDVENKPRCTNPMQVVPPFNNSPGAILQSEAATRIVLSTEDGREAFPEVDPKLPVCSSFALDNVYAAGDPEAEPSDEEIATANTIESTEQAAGEAAAPTS